MTRQEKQLRCRNRPWWKKAVFGLAATVLFIGLFELMLLIAGVGPVTYRDDPYVGFSSYSPLYVTAPGDDGTSQRVTAQNKLDWFNPQSFAVHKATRAYRVFCLGGSTTYGRPYDDRTSFAGWLRAFLPAADDARDWEVINAGGISYASYRVAQLMEELIGYGPDLFIIYCGHNEFLERRTYASIIETPKTVRDLETMLGRTRTYWLFRRLIKGQPRTAPTKAADDADTDGGNRLSAEVESILDDAVGPDVYTRDRALQEKILSHYRFNLHRMIEMARSAGAQVMLVVPASNLRDCSPFKSEHRADLSESDQFRRLDFFNQAQAAYDQGQQAEALRLADASQEIDDDVADVHYLRGRILWELKRHEEAKVAFARARDEDVCPLRALTLMDDIVRQTAQQHDVPLVDLVRWMEEHSEHGVPGKAWFLDHVHLTVEGNRRLALELMEVMEAARIVQPRATWNEDAVQRVVQRVESEIDRTAHAQALKNLSKVLAWAGKREEAAQLALRAVAVIPDDAEAQYQAGSAHLERGELEQAIACFQTSLALRPGHANSQFGLGKAFGARRDSTAAVTHYQQAIALNSDYDDAHYNLARLYEGNGQIQQAVQHYQEALRINPEHFFSHNNLGSIFARQEDFDSAGKHFRLAIQAKPNFAHAQFNLGMLEQLRGNAERAKESFRAALRSQPNHFTAAFQLSNLLATHPQQSVRNGAQAVFWAERLAQSTEMDEFWIGVGGRAVGFQRADVLSVLAAAYAEVGEFEKAVESQQAAIDLLPAGQRGDYRSRLESYGQGNPYRQPTAR